MEKKLVLKNLHKSQPFLYTVNRGTLTSPQLKLQLTRYEKYENEYIMPFLYSIIIVVNMSQVIEIQYVKLSKVIYVRKNIYIDEGVPTSPLLSRLLSGIPS